MTAYIVGTIRILQPEVFSKYSEAIRGVSGQFGGEPVVAGPVSEVLEGDSPVGERVVVTKFPTAAQARAYLTSPVYLAAKKLREGAADIELRLIET